LSPGEADPRKIVDYSSKARREYICQCKPPLDAERKKRDRYVTTVKNSRFVVLDCVSEEEEGS